MPDALLTDIRLELLHHRWRAVYAASADGRDFALVSGPDNLGQAVSIRLLTPLGELAPLGHPDYGSRLHELIGQPNSATRRNLAKLYVLDALRGEPRIASLAGVDVAAVAGAPDCVEVTVHAVPAGDADVVTIGPLRLELA
jgi:phage baseplate assembly protein W